MPISSGLQRWGLEQASERLHQERMRRRERAAELRGDTGVGATGVDTGAPGRPELPDIPEFQLPEYEEEEVAAIAQKIAGPQVRRLRETTRAAITRRGPGYENPNIRRMTVRQALQGYGTGLEGIISGARRGAVAEYAQQYAPRVQAAQTTWQARVQASMAQYGNLWGEYMTNLRAQLAEEAGRGPTATGAGLRVDPGYRRPPSLAETPWTVTEWGSRNPRLG